MTHVALLEFLMYGSSFLVALVRAHSQCELRTRTEVARLVTTLCCLVVTLMWTIIFLYATLVATYQTLARSLLWRSIYQLHRRLSRHPDSEEVLVEASADNHASDAGRPGMVHFFFVFAATLEPEAIFVVVNAAVIEWIESRRRDQGLTIAPLSPPLPDGLPQPS